MKIWETPLKQRICLQGREGKAKHGKAEQGQRIQITLQIQGNKNEWNVDSVTLKD